MNFTKYRIVIAGLFGFSLCISISLAQILGALLIIDALIQLRFEDKRELWKKPYLLYAIVLYVLWGGVSTGLINPAGLKKAVSVYTAFLFYFLVVAGFEEKQVRSALIGFCWGAVLAGIWGCVQKWSGSNFLPNENIIQAPEFMSEWPKTLVHYLSLRNDRAVGPRSHPLTYAESLVPAFFLWAFVLFVFFRRDKKDWWVIVLTSISFLFVAAGLVYSEGRGVLLSVLVLTPIFGLSMGRKPFAAAALFILIGFISLTIFSGRFRGRMMSAFSNQQGSISDQQSKSIRLQLWKETIQRIRTRPFTGMGTKGVAITLIDPVENKERVWTETHNIYLQTAAEMGLVGLGLFIWLLFLIGRLIVNMKGVIKAPFIGCVGAYVIAGLTESWINDKEITMIFWFLVGCAEFLSKRNYGSGFEKGEIFNENQ